MNDHNIKIAESDFKHARDLLLLFIEYQGKFYENFLNVKLGFLAFIGVIFAILFSNIENFSCSFLISFLVIIFFVFLLFIWELWGKLQDVYITLKEQQRSTLLAKIRHIATAESEYENYGKDAERLFFQEDKVRQAMQEQKPIEEIIKYKENIWWKLEFALWTCLFLSIPVLFLLELTGVFK